MSKSQELANLVGGVETDANNVNLKVNSINDGPVGGRRNLIINGAMQVWQRGTSSSSAGYQTADRFYHYVGNGLTHIQSTDVPTGEGFTYSLGTTGTPSGEWNVGQSIELPADGEAGVFFNGQTITISYWAKSSVAGDKIWNAVLFRDSHVSSSNQSIVDFDNTDNNELTTSWARYTKTYTIGVAPNGTNKALTVQIRSRNNAEDSSTPQGNIYITGVQLELGSVATAFEHRSYGEELALCQRYFTRFSWNGDFDAIGSGLIKSSGNEARIIVPLPVSMRSNPSASFTGTGLTVFDAATYDNSTTLQRTFSGRHSLMIDVNVNGLTASRPATLHLESGVDAFNLDAEL